MEQDTEGMNRLNYVYLVTINYLVLFSITHEVFGDIKKLLTQELVRQGYLDMTRQPNMDPPVTEFRWGQRAKLETSKRKVLDFVSKVTVYHVYPDHPDFSYIKIITLPVSRCRHQFFRSGNVL